MNKLTPNQNLFENIKNLIEQTKQTVAVAVNSLMTLMYWNMGKTINDEIIKAPTKLTIETLHDFLSIYYGTLLYFEIKSFGITLIFNFKLLFISELAKFLISSRNVLISFNS